MFDMIVTSLHPHQTHLHTKRHKAAEPKLSGYLLCDFCILQIFYIKYQ